MDFQSFTAHKKRLWSLFSLYIFNNYSSEILKKFLSFKNLAKNSILNPDIEKTFMVLFESTLSKKKIIIF